MVFYSGADSWHNETSSNYVLCVWDSINSASDFNQIVEGLIVSQPQSNSKPLEKLNLVRDEFEATKEFSARVKKPKEK